MAIIENPLMLIPLSSFIAIHAATEFLPRTAARIVGYVNILLHALAVLPLGILKFTIEEAVLFYMISVFFFTLIRTASFIVREKRAQGEKRDTHSADGGDDSEGSCGEGSV